MNINIKWTAAALEDYLSNIEYLEIHWTDSEVTKFIDEVDNIITLLKVGNVVFKQSKYRNVFELPVVPKIQLFYRFIDDYTIELLRFWNNKKNPKSLKL
ncbi:MAG: type II toxin-antitoxin system RelE/ParE family toxin [Chitinophagales bacterium]